MSTLLRLILAFMLVVFFCPASSNAETDEVTMMEQAKHHLSAGKLYFATSWLEKILKYHPKSLKREEVLLLLAKTYAASERYDRAATTLRTLLKEYPKAAASLDSKLLKLAESHPQPEPASNIMAIPSAQAKPAERKSLSSPAAEPVKIPSTATTTLKNIPKSVVAPLIQSKPTVIKPAAALLPTTAESTAKMITIPQAAVPAPPNVENALSVGKPNKTTEIVTYTLDIGAYADKSGMIDTMSKINKAGLSTFLEQGLKKDQPIIRLYIGEFSDQESARKEQEKLRTTNVESYILMNGSNKLQVFVGAYLDQNLASKEQHRLSNLGINLSLKKVVVSVPTFLLSAGTFKTRETALEMAVELEKQGVKSSVVIQRPPSL